VAASNIVPACSAVSVFAISSFERSTPTSFAQATSKTPSASIQRHFFSFCPFATVLREI